MSTEIHSKIFDLLRELQKEVSQVEASLKSHLDSSEPRVKAYDEDIKELKFCIQKLEESVKVLNTFKATYEGQKKGWQEFKTSLGWVVGFLATLFSLMAYFGIVKK